MKFSFSKKYRFSCKKCGACCKQKTISLTDEEFSRLKKVIAAEKFEKLRDFNFSSDIVLHEVSFKGKSCVYNKPIKGKNLCSNYASRFLQCIIFPLSFSAFPDGELIVNLAHCSGVSLEEGAFVNEEFVNKIIEDVKRIDESFLKELVELHIELHNSLIPFFGKQDVSEFKTKVFFMNKITHWLTARKFRKIPIDTRIRALYELLSSFFQNKLSHLRNLLDVDPPLIITLTDARKFAFEFEKVLETKFMTVCEKIEISKEKELEEILSTGETEFFVDNELERFKINDIITYKSDRVENIRVKVSDLIKEKPLSDEANENLSQYLQELCNRFGHGGLMANVPFIYVLETLYRFSSFLVCHARAYSQDSKIIEQDHIDDAITYFDSRNRIGDNLQVVLAEEGIGHKKMEGAG